MCAQHSSSLKSRWFNTPILYLVMIALGIFAGLSESGFLKASGLFVADVFIHIFKCISLPIISLSIIVTLSNYTAGGVMQQVWRRTMFYTLSTTLVAALVSAFLYNLIQPALISSAPVVMPLPIDQTSYWTYLANLIPSTLFSPFIEQQVLSVLLISVVMGTAVRFIPDSEARKTIYHFFKGAHGLFMVMTRWVIAIIPLGLFGFITSSVVQLKSGGSIKGIGQYLLVILLANCVQGLLVLPLWLKSHGIRPFSAMRAMLPALSIAFFSKSSVGSLPVTMETIEKNLNVRPSVSRAVLPLCTSINMNGCAAFIWVTVIYLMQNQGIHVSLPSMLMWVVVATIAAIGNAGVPMGCFFLSTSLLASMNVPITLMGIILPFYTLIDMLETGLNVWSDVCVTKVVDETLQTTSDEELVDSMKEQLLT